MSFLQKIVFIIVVAFVIAPSTTHACIKTSHCAFVTAAIATGAGAILRHAYIVECRNLQKTPSMSDFSLFIKNLIFNKQTRYGMIKGNPLLLPAIAATVVALFGTIGNGVYNYFNPEEIAKLEVSSDNLLQDVNRITENPVVNLVEKPVENLVVNPVDKPVEEPEVKPEDKLDVKPEDKLDVKPEDKLEVKLEDKLEVKPGAKSVSPAPVSNKNDQNLGIRFVQSTKVFVQGASDMWSRFNGSYVMF